MSKATMIFVAALLLSPGCNHPQEVDLHHYLGYFKSIKRDTVAFISFSGTGNGLYQHAKRLFLLNLPFDTLEAMSFRDTEIVIPHESYGVMRMIRMDTYRWGDLENDVGSTISLLAPGVVFAEPEGSKEATLADTIPYSVSVGQSYAHGSVTIDGIETLEFGDVVYQDCLIVRWSIPEGVVRLWVSRERFVVQYWLTHDDGSEMIAFREKR